VARYISDMPATSTTINDSTVSSSLNVSSIGIPVLSQMLCKTRKAFGVSVCQMMACGSVDGVERGGSEVAGEAKHVSRQNFLGTVNNNHTTLLPAMLMMHDTMY
jgi:hypothetical protein